MANQDTTKKATKRFRIVMLIFCLTLAFMTYYFVDRGIFRAEFWLNDGCVRADILSGNSYAEAIKPLCRKTEILVPIVRLFSIIEIFALIICSVAIWLRKNWVSNLLTFLTLVGLLVTTYFAWVSYTRVSFLSIPAILPIVYGVFFFASFDSRLSNL